MALRLLVAIDGSERSMRAVQHVRQVMSEGCDCQVTLFHIRGIPADLLEHEGSAYTEYERQSHKEMGQRRDAWETKTRAAVENEVFGPARQVLVEDSEDSESTRVLNRLECEPHHRIASSILWEAERGEYDAVVLGRHGHSCLQEFLLGSVSSKVIHHLTECSVWVVE
jgi:nucleotide-binding universal stress UspA family protein